MIFIAKWDFFVGKRCYSSQQQQHTKAPKQINMMKHQFQLFPESIWWQHTLHLAPPPFFLLLLEMWLQRSSAHQRPDSVKRVFTVLMWWLDKIEIKYNIDTGSLRPIPILIFGQLSWTQWCLDFFFKGLWHLVKMCMKENILQLKNKLVCALWWTHYVKKTLFLNDTYLWHFYIWISCLFCLFLTHQPT